MLKKRFRLKEKEEFERVFRQGKPLFFGSIGCKIAPNTLGHLRLGFSFSKKYLKTAVERNRLRRVISAGFLAEGDFAPANQAYDVVFFAAKPLPSGPAPDVASMVQSVVEYISR